MLVLMDMFNFWRVFKITSENKKHIFDSHFEDTK